VSEATFGVRFRKARQDKKLTQAKVAELLKISQSAVAQWESGRSFPSTGIATNIRKLLGIEVGAPDDGEPAQPRARRQTRLPIVGLPAPGDDERIVIDGGRRGDIPTPPQLDNVSGAFAVYVRGRSMEPRYYEGEVIYLNPGRPPNIGDFVLVTVTEPRSSAQLGYIRQYLGEDLVHIHLATLNPKKKHVVARDSLVGMATIVGSGLL
jgi:transcriptional regulator with XRE-family HTH domain